MDDSAAPVLLALDGNSLVHRSFHAQGSSEQPAWAVRGLLSQLVAAVDRVQPSAVVIGFDDPQQSLRRQQWPQYKANRPDKLPSLVEQLAAAVDTMRALGVAVLVPEGLEADDVLASAAVCAQREGGRAVIVTSDRDAFSLIDDHTSVLRIINGGVEASPLLTPERLVTMYGVRPEQYRDYAALRGDTSDNLPGVMGIGEKTAARLLARFGTAAAAFDDLAAVADAFGPGIARRLAEPTARAAWELNHQVMAQRADLDLDLDLRSGVGTLPLDADTVSAIYRAHNLTWSASQALRVLAHVEVGAEAPAPRNLRPWDGPWQKRADGPSTRKTRPAKPAAPINPQLALF